MKQAKAIVSSITQVGMDDHEKVKAIHDYVVNMFLMIRLIKLTQHMKHL